MRAQPIERSQPAWSTKRLSQRAAGSARRLGDPGLSEPAAPASHRFNLIDQEPQTLVRFFGLDFKYFRFEYRPNKHRFHAFQRIIHR
jgi:hypothetical protein